MTKRGIPDRWERYTPFGNVIGQTRFIAFKVPLKESLCRGLPATMRFTPSNLISSVDKLGMVIDLTNTRRYYNSAEITDCGVAYLKIFCEGRVVPDRNVVEKFFEAVENFLRNNDKGLIGVHCTHGVNRTGYLICKYMVDKLRYDAKDAIREFNTARGHDIERVAYINHLCRTENDESHGKHYETWSESGGWPAERRVRDPRFQAGKNYATNATNYGRNYTRDYCYGENSRHDDFNSIERRQRIESSRFDYWYEPPSNDEGRRNSGRKRSRTHTRNRQRFDRDSNYQSLDDFHANRQRVYDGTFF
ncbi:RNA/RNP complex-1-interacting phosphatase-like [Centruroides sculpturatus]|uniref:RNA/RNP complex-1-interacting phosphatase-like n=1 Tax=Centruroides sculpturatus TaxID=218467 RepID=UPI000C6C9C63|nr:RNA/RNP complex-1-interacting phosphatase-like [Centruroides sculpturatus]